MSHPHRQLSGLGARALKGLSQNFLTSPHWVQRLTDGALSLEADELWEIGPGLGALTERLLAETKIPVRLFEFDKKLAARLAEKHPKVPIEIGDVMEADFEKIAGGKRIAVLSNLPYHLSSPILFKFLESKVRWQGFVLTFQREYADRLLALPRTPDYAGLSVVFQWHFEAEKLGILPPGAFFPPPRVDSTALRLKLKGAPYPPEFGALVRASFQFRRKTLSNCLKGFIDKEELAKGLEPLGFSPQSRPEELSPAHYLELAKRWSSRFAKPGADGNQVDSRSS